MDRLFLDANVLFTAAHNRAGKSAYLFDVLHFARWELHSSDYAIEEARRNLAAKFPERVAILDSLIGRLNVIRQPARGEIGIRLPEKDQPIFLAAQAGGATHLLTGDLRHFKRHMNRPQQTSGIVIQTVADYLSSL
ncbi:MAG: PIN domain-containing protein [Steroidobacteraceae bacterium]